MDCTWIRRIKFPPLPHPPIQPQVQRSTLGLSWCVRGGQERHVHISRIPVPEPKQEKSMVEKKKRKSRARVCARGAHRGVLTLGSRRINAAGLTRCLTDTIRGPAGPHARSDGWDHLSPLFRCGTTRAAQITELHLYRDRTGPCQRHVTIGPYRSQSVWVHFGSAFVWLQCHPRSESYFPEFIVLCIYFLG